MGRTETVKRKVLESGAELLHEGGVPAFTVEAISKRSGVAKSTVYRHWPGGDDLLVDTMRSLIAPIPTPNTGSLHTDLAQLLRTMLPASAEETADTICMMFSVVQTALDDADLLRAVDDLLRERSGPIRTVVELAKARGEVDPELDLELAVDLVEGPFLHWHLRHREVIEHDEFEAMLGRVVAGLQATPAAAR